MSCQNNANRGKVAAVKCAISSTASKAAYISGVAVGASVGGAAGAVIGTALMPGLGTVGGAVTGAWAGGKVSGLKYRRKVRKAEERRWQDSSQGQQATSERDSQLGQLKIKYEKAKAPLVAARQEAEADYESARDAGIAQIDSRGAANQELIRSAGNLLGQAVLSSRWGKGGSDMVGVVGRGMVGEAMSLEKRIRQAKTDAWKQTPAGRKATDVYRQKVTALDAKRRQLKLEYKVQADKVESAYRQARTSFLSGES